MNIKFFLELLLLLKNRNLRLFLLGLLLITGISIKYFKYGQNNYELIVIAAIALIIVKTISGMINYMIGKKISYCMTKWILLGNSILLFSFGILTNFDPIYVPLILFSTGIGLIALAIRNMPKEKKSKD